MTDQIFEHKKNRYVELRAAGLLADHFDKKDDLGTVAQFPEGTENVHTAGRVIALRVMGKILFAHLFDFSGKMQIFVRSNPDATTGSDIFKQFVDQVSIGDFVGVQGEIFKTKTGELTIRVAQFQLLNKCLRTLPDKFHGIEDIENRYRKRYLDIIMNEASRNVFRKRIEIIKTLRSFLDSNGYLEMETPILQTTPSGALARPFETHHNALDMTCVLRIACETYLKRCIGAGMDRVYEFARTFRNEGVSATHLQDFTMLEFYASYWNANVMMGFVEKMMRDLIAKIFGTAKVSLQGIDIDFSQPWPVYEYNDLILKDCGIDLSAKKDRNTLIQAIQEKGIKIDEDLNTISYANLVDALYKKVSRPKLIQPCFLSKYPVELAPLARRNPKDPTYVDFFQFIVNGVELVKAYSELVDPLDQRERFQEQAQDREAGDEEAMPLDEDYLMAMEHGFPPIAGVGIGIDRLTMILCGCDNIKDTVLFPLLRPQAPQSYDEDEKVNV